ncbi:MAG TPA: hypothetical protein VMZ06_15940 [Candidatus Bathyarchaeia archaeon]|nr:hypothetical protein [Candidatus Bathyarchaeia archaeon]
MPSSYLGDTRGKLRLLEFPFIRRASAIAEDITRHTNKNVRSLGGFLPHQFSAAGIGVLSVVVALLAGWKANAPWLAFLIFLAGSGAAIYVGFGPWFNAAKALLSHFLEETGTHVADPDAGLDAQRIVSMPVGNWEIWKTVTIERKEFANGWPVVWSVLHGSPKRKLDELQDALNRHWAFHKRYPRLSGDMSSRS